MSDTKHVHQVCNACKLRKKACDKALPACGFCTTRRLFCRYEVSAPNSIKGRRRHNPGRYFVPLQSPSPPRLAAQAKTAPRQLPSLETQQDHSPIHHSRFYVFSPSSIDKSLNDLAEHFFELTGTASDDIIDRYFQPIHRWLPVVSPDALRQEAWRYREDGSPPPADFTVLILAMLLMLLPTLDPSVRQSVVTEQRLYVATKSASSQTQASICTSLRLAQAGLLIALREYTCVRPETAYISLMTCVGISRVLSTETISMRSTTALKRASESSELEKELENLAGGIAMLERLILCEMNQKDLRPQTEYPNRLITITLEAAVNDHFRRQAKSVSLLDRLLAVTNLPVTKETKLRELASLDGETRDFVKEVMSESEWMATPHCVHVALCVRLLFLLHGTVFDCLEGSQSEADQQRREISLTGLALVCKMTLDVAEWHGEGRVHMMPICCYYNLRLARERMQERNRDVGDEALSRDIDILMRAEENYRAEWVF